jgi:uncharacterized protein (TIGR03086 family)
VDIIDRYDKAAHGFTARLDAVTDHQWENPTPCTDWNVRQLVDHVIDVQRKIPEMLGAEFRDGSDLQATWRSVRDAALSALRQPGAIERTVKTPGGETPIGQSLGVRLSDLTVHTWDLARATGGDERLDPETAAIVYARLKPNDKALRSSGIMGPKVEPPPGADVQTELLCFTGRRP